MTVTWTTDSRRATTWARAYRTVMGWSRDDQAFSGAARTLRTALARQRAGDRPPTRWTRLVAEVEERMLDGHLVWSLRPRRGPVTVEVLYLHGGGYVHPLTVDYWRLARSLVRGGAQVVVPCYPLAPTHTVDQALPWLERVRAQLLPAEGADPHRSVTPLVLMGDSAGGALALSLAARLRGSDLQAALVVALCPWLDATLQQPEVTELEPTDPVLAESGLRAAGRWWSGAWSATHHLVSPALAEPEQLRDLPPVDLWIGDHDILRPAVDSFVERLAEAGGDVQVHEVRAMFHVWMTRALPEARRTRRRLVDRLRALTRSEADDRSRPADARVGGR